MAVSLELKKNVQVDGKNCDSLDHVPPELRALIEKALALAPGAAKTSTITVNGKAYSSVEELPAALRAMVRGAAALAASHAAAAAPKNEPLRPEPVVSTRVVFVTLALAALFFLLYRAMS